MPGGVRSGGQLHGGGIIGYPSTRLFEEVAYIAYHFHWPYQQIVQLEHVERRKWVDEIAKINNRLIAAARQEEEAL